MTKWKQFTLNIVYHLSDKRAAVFKNKVLLSKCDAELTYVRS